jgi:hypothetical protein
MNHVNTIPPKRLAIAADVRAEAEFRDRCARSSPQVVAHGDIRSASRGTCETV